MDILDWIIELEMEIWVNNEKGKIKPLFFISEYRFYCDSSLKIDVLTFTADPNDDGNNSGTCRENVTEPELGGLVWVSAPGWDQPSRGPGRPTCTTQWTCSRTLSWTRLINLKMSEIFQNQISFLSIRSGLYKDGKDQCTWHDEQNLIRFVVSSLL